MTGGSLHLERSRHPNFEGGGGCITGTCQTKIVCIEVLEYVTTLAAMVA